MLKCHSFACAALLVLIARPALTYAQPSGAGFGALGESGGGSGLEGYGSMGSGGDMVDPLQFELDGEPRHASRVRWFRVNVSTLQVEIQPAPEMGMDMYGGDMMGSGMGGDGGSGMMGGGAGMPGGMSDGMGMGMGMGGYGGMPGAAPISNTVNVAAFILDDEQTEGRTRIEVLISGTNNTWHRLDAEGIDSVLKHHAMLNGIRFGKKAKDSNSLVWTLDEGKLVTKLIRLKVWKDDAIKLLRSEAGKGEKSAAAEKLLKLLLTEDYEAQLMRQEVELARLKERIQRIQEELARRHAAKDRVVDVQLGKIMLEAQGILGNSDF